jgi:hypothetical protein
MRCSKCGSENLLGKKFCGDCGGPLGSPCPKCGADNPFEKRFCGECGAALVDAATHTSVASATKPGAPGVRVTAANSPGDALEGERKTVNQTPRQITQNGKTILHHRCTRCARDFAQGLNGAGCRRFTSECCASKLLAQCVNRRWLTEPCPKRLLPADNGDRTMRRS